ncbi:MAG: gliding motility protein GldM [Cytophagaceae bacterium]|nr:gliding motility protein GldM [Cytophagaceae bacterium]MDW8457015.1 gliding motility protein GldM [Cytophagaceae bacterium]
MAGGKETPRQKMIGMMYLVLTALLALQVSSAIMEKFKFLDDSLQYANDAMEHDATILLDKIKKAVADAGGKASDLAIQSKAEAVRKEAKEIKEYIDNLRKEIVTETGGYEDNDPKKMYKGAKEETKIEVMLIGTEGAKNGKGYKLKEEVNKFVDDLNKALPNRKEKFAYLALDAKDDPRITSEEQKTKDFAQLNFGQTPMVAAMAVLSNLESEVLRYETTALEELAQEIGASDLKFDQVVAMVRPYSKVVASGTKYEADMFLAASSSAITPTMTCRGQAIKVDPKTKIGKVEFKATIGGSFDPKMNAYKNQWEGKISFKFKGKDTTFTVKEEYYVAKPVVQVESGTVVALYRNCGNELNVQVPALGTAYNPKFTADGAEVITTPGKKGVVTLVPTGTSVKLKVYSNGEYIDDVNFKVRLIPKPTIEAISNGRPVDEKLGMPAPGPRSITMKAIADEGFKNSLPNDARYKVTEWECTLVRGKRPLATQKVTGETANLASFAAQAQPGDRISIEVKNVVRTNYLNKTESVNLGSVVKNITLH